MKLKWLLVLITIYTSAAKAQDMILTQYGDTINKKVIYSTKRYLFYVDSNYYGKYYVKGIRKSRIVTSQMNAYKVDRHTAMMNQRAKDVMGNPYMIQGGMQLGFLPIPVDSESTSSYKKFIQDLRLGFSFNVSFLLRMRPHTLIGIFIDDFHSNAFAEKLDIPDNSGVIQHLQNIKSSISMFQVGPEFVLFKDSKKFKHFFIVSGGIGYSRFNWNISAANRSSENYRAAGVGIRGSIAQTWALGKTFIVGPNFKFQLAAIADQYGLAGIVPRLNLGVTVLVH